MLAAAANATRARTSCASLSATGIHATAGLSLDGMTNRLPASPRYRHRSHPGSSAPGRARRVRPEEGEAAAWRSAAAAFSWSSGVWRFAAAHTASAETYPASSAASEGEGATCDAAVVFPRASLVGPAEAPSAARGEYAAGGADAVDATGEGASGHRGGGLGRGRVRRRAFLRVVPDVDDGPAGGGGSRRVRCCGRELAAAGARVSAADSSRSRSRSRRSTSSRTAPPVERERAGMRARASARGAREPRRVSRGAFGPSEEKPRVPRVLKKDVIT